MASRGSPEAGRGRIMVFPVSSGVKAERGAVRQLTPEEVGTIMIYRYYGEVGRTYSVSAVSGQRFLGYMQVLSQMYNLNYADGQPDAQGQVREKFLFEPDNPEALAAEQRFCAVLQVGDEGNISSVSFRMLPTRPLHSSTSPGPRLRLLRNE